MATTTPNYGWTVPTSTDLVKDGATAIETLGDAIDASMNTALGTKKAGMVLLNTTSFSGVASQSFNNVFSATYDNYLILGTLIQSTDTTFSLRNRVGGVDASGTDYDVNVVDNVSSTTTSTSSLTFAPGANLPCTIRVTMVSPFEALRTKFLYETLSGLNTNQRRGAATHDLTTSYDGFTLLTSAGTFLSGSKVSIYGYSK